MSVSINGTNGLTFNDGSTQATAGFSPFRNRIINGDMRIDQRNNGASGTAIAFTIDRWGYGATQSSKGTWQRNAGSVTPPTSFDNYWGFTSSSAYSLAASDQFYFYQGIEGFNVSDLGLGAAGASSFTISFWVRSSLTGTLGASVQNSAQNRSYPFSYTINAANTWEYKTVTIAGDTTGTWLKTNGCGMYLLFSLGTGSSFQGTANTWASSNVLAPTGATSVVGTNGATFYITGVQLEPGTSATPFERRSYGVEDLLCKRYAYRIDSATASDGYLRYHLVECLSTTAAQGVIPLPVQMRATPSLTTPAASQFALYTTSTIISATAVSLLTASNPNSVGITYTVASGLTAGRAAQAMSNNNNTSYMLLTAEL